MNFTKCIPLYFIPLHLLLDEHLKQLKLSNVFALFSQKKINGCRMFAELLEQERFLEKALNIRYLSVFVLSRIQLLFSSLSFRQPLNRELNWTSS